MGDRLTEKLNKRYATASKNLGLDCSAFTDMVFGGNVINKLGELEDIEQELGIDLITLIIAFRKGIYDLENGKWYSFSTYELYIDNRLNIHNRKNGKVYHFVDKGISWCLTKEELETEKYGTK